ncbi:MAG: UTP--glucose-1-phosphate uridylyltransferase [Nitrospinaceae bacterium]
MDLSEFKTALEPFGLPDDAQSGFLHLFTRFKQSRKNNLEWDAIRSPDPSRLISYEALTAPDDTQTADALSCLAVCKLNGGLGTSMGCAGPKSSIAVKNGQSFLDLILLQLEHIEKTKNVNIPLFLMNSFHTHQETLKLLEGRKTSFPIECFQQNRFLRIDKDTDQPLDPNLLGEDAWYPPGHGDIYSCLKDQGLIDRLLSEGKEILFVSNADNLGAVADSKIAHTMLAEDIPFVMEMTPKTPADIKGGTLYEDSEGKLHLLELAQVPQKHVDEFCSTRKFTVFNTNNIWIHLRHLKKRLEQGPVNLNLIVNEKQVAGRPIIQLETAIGSGLESFDKAKGLVVGRDRFLPVKNTSDLMLLQSGLFVFEGGRMTHHPTPNQKSLPRVTWKAPFTNLEEFQKRIPVIPDMRELESLEMEGDVCFEGEVSLKGRVTLIGNDKPVRIPSGTCLENRQIIQ